MFQVIAFLLTGIFALLTTTAEGYGRGTQTKGSAKYKQGAATASQEKLIKRTRDAMNKNAYVRGKCRGELNKIHSIAQNIARAQNPTQANQKLEQARLQARNCTRRISPVGISHTPSGKWWYSQYVLEQKYRKDFKKYPKLKNQFEGAMERAYTNYRKLSRNDSMAVPLTDFINYIKSHPHFQNPHSSR